MSSSRSYIIAAVRPDLDPDLKPIVWPPLHAVSGHCFGAQERLAAVVRASIQMVETSKARFSWLSGVLRPLSSAMVTRLRERRTRMEEG